MILFVGAVRAHYILCGSKITWGGLPLGLSSGWAMHTNKVVYKQDPYDGQQQQQHSAEVAAMFELSTIVSSEKNKV